jgi:hypothetical protein
LELIHSLPRPSDLDLDLDFIKHESVLPIRPDLKITRPAAGPVPVEVLESALASRKEGKKVLVLVCLPQSYVTLFSRPFAWRCADGQSDETALWGLDNRYEARCYLWDVGSDGPDECRSLQARVGGCESSEESRVCSPENNIIPAYTAFAYHVHVAQYLYILVPYNQGARPRWSIT